MFKERTCVHERVNKTIQYSLTTFKRKSVITNGRNSHNSQEQYVLIILIICLLRKFHTSDTLFLQNPFHKMWFPQF